MEVDNSDTVLNHSVSLSELQNLSVTEHVDGFVIALTDLGGFEVVRGFGLTVAEALNDMHRNLI
jgi:hypothetical protein